MTKKCRVCGKEYEPMQGWVAANHCFRHGMRCFLMAGLIGVENE